VTIGKGFPGGQYPASKIIATAGMDNLSQFGALVTNGQEEVAALSYLVTMAFALANAGLTSRIGDYYESELRRVAAARPALVKKVEGYRLLSSIYFHEADKAVAFTRLLNARGIDISAHTYKAECEPSALTKPPLTTTPKAVDFLISRIDEALAAIE
jgi:acetylornithine/succinyldiaminopimelate/putrescine aminotransferase